MKGVRAIRKELAILITKRKKENPEFTPQQINVLVDKCRTEINTKYGKGWRESMERVNFDLANEGKRRSQRADPPHEDPTSPYYGHVNGEHWMD